MTTLKGTMTDDSLNAGQDFIGLEDTVLGLDGNDAIDVGLGSGGNTLGGGNGDDLLFAGKNDLLLGDRGNDELDASDEGGNNSLYGGAGQDTIYAGENDKVFGGSGDDSIFAGTGNNTLYGGTGRDRFWLANAEAPTSVNIVADFDAQADQLVIKLDGVDSLSNLNFEQTGADTVIKLAATGESLGVLKNVNTGDLNAKNVVFEAQAPASSVRVATFNASLNRNNLGQLISDLSTPNHPQAKNIAEIIQRNNPDILLLNEFDYDAQGEAISLFKSNYLEVSQNGVAPVDYPYIYLAPSNTGVDSGLDLDKNGILGQGNDAFGFGTFPGQYGMVLLSKYPLITDQARTFQNFLWKDMPGNLLTNDPTANPLSGENGYYSPEAVDILRLSSKSHWDIPVNVNGEIIHILAAHPTPPVFDGAEDRNGKRNYDEIRFWSDYVTPGKGDYAYDDQEKVGGLKAGERFVILGDYNADPFDGDSYQGAANQFFNTPAIAGSTTDIQITPGSQGATEASQSQGGMNAQHQGNPGFDTGDFADNSPGNLRIDYVLPSTNLSIKDGGVFWPTKSDPLFGIVGEYDPTLDPNIYPSRTPSSDHRLVYNDLIIPTQANTQARKTVKGVENLGLVTFNTDTVFKDTQVGGLSGIVYDSAQNRYYTISDDRSQINPARFYTLEINLNDGRLDNGDVSFTGVTSLLDSEGSPFPLNSLDPEGIALTENGSVYISSEGDANALINPFVNEFSLSGQQLAALPIDDKYFPTADKSKGIRNNLAFESLTLTPDRRYLYTATENALAQDGTAATLTDSSFSRIVKYDVVTGQVVAEYVYEVDAVAQTPDPAGSFATNGLVELLALDNNGTLLALERSFSTGVGNTVKLYEVSTQGALNVKDLADLYREDPLEDDGEIIAPDRFAIDPPVQKRLLLDFADLGITPDNLEGISLGPVLPDGRQSLIVVSDNNFSATQTTQFIALGLTVDTLPAVLPTVETPYTIDDGSGTTPLIGDSDDPAVWIDPTDSENSLVIGTLKDGGLAVFSLEGEVLQTVTPVDMLGAGAEFGDLRYNNVDVLYNFQLGAETVDIAVVSDRANDTLNIFKINPATYQLESITAPTLLNDAFSIFGVDDGDITAYGLAGYKSPVTGKSYVFVTQAGGNKIAQLELQATESGTITASVVRTIELPIAEGDEAEDYQSEAIAIDQEKGIVYLAVEGKIGIVKFAAEPNGSNQITVVRPVGSPELVPDLEGLAIYYGPNGTGYLVASSQGDSSYAIYSREGSNSYLGSFVVGDNTALGIDQANETDGLEIINVPLGSAFPFGAFLVQDGANDPQNVVENDDELENNATNFKFVRWDDVANAFKVPLMVDSTSYNPRNSDLNPQSLVNGIASGDVDQNSAVLWARSLFVGQVTFEYSTSANFSAIAGTATVNVTDATLPVKVTITGLNANTEYFYRVTDAAGDSATGRFQTAAVLGSKTGLSFGVTGDWRGELAPYQSVSNVADKNLDFFAKLGDTIYADYGSDAVLNPDGSRKAQVETLEEYRAKHAEVYGSRFGENYLADIRRSTSILATIDDHEVINDFAGGELAANDERFGESTGLINDTDLYEDGLQAFQEYNPLEDQRYADNTGDERFDGEHKLYRYNTYGSDAAVITLDARSFRDQAISFTDANGDGIPDDLNGNGTQDEIAGVLVKSLTEDRTMLGSVQLQDLKADLLKAQADGVTWKFVMIPEPIQNILPGITVDSYEGYGKERTELLKFIEDNGIQNVVFVSADVHSTYVNNLTYQEVTQTGIQQFAVPVLEITTGSVAFDPPTGKIFASVAIATAQNPALGPFYNSLPINPDPTDSATPDDKDDFVEQALNTQVLAPGGFDPLGLDHNLAIADGMIDANLLQGDYYVGHTFGWSQFEIDPTTQALTITTYGIDSYTEAELLANPTAILSRQPRIVSQFAVNPNVAPVISNQTFNLPENSPIGTTVGAIAATDVNNNIATYAFTQPNSRFALNADTGLLTLIDANGLDFELNPVPEFIFDVIVTDVTGLSNTATVTVKLTNVNDPPTDGNFDGIPDAEQPHVTSIQTPNNQFVTFVGDPLLPPAQIQAIANPSPDNAPANVTFPLGFFDFTLPQVTPGGASAITLYLPQGTNINTYWKFGPTPDNPSNHWYNFDFDPITQTGAQFTDLNGDGQTEVILNFVDGQRGDRDLTVNGQIQDPGAPAFTPNSAPTAITLSNLLSLIDENSNGGIKVADLTIIDDGQGINTLFLSGNDAASFEIRDNALFFIGSSPDFERQTQYQVTVNVDDPTVGNSPDAMANYVLQVANLPDFDVSNTAPQFSDDNNDGLGSLTYDFSGNPGNTSSRADDSALSQTNALFHNLIGLYPVLNANGAILDSLDSNGNGLTTDLLNPGDAGYAFTAISNRVNNFSLQLGANGNLDKNTSAAEFGDVLIQGGQLYAPFAIANGGNLIPNGGSMQDGINAFVLQNPNNTAATLDNFITHAVAYFSFGMANPDGAEHLQNRGNNIFGFEDLPGNLGVSDFDFNDAVFRFNFLA